MAAQCIGQSREDFVTTKGTTKYITKTTRSISQSMRGHPPQDSERVMATQSKRLRRVPYFVRAMGAWVTFRESVVVGPAHWQKSLEGGLAGRARRTKHQKPADSKEP